MYVPNFLKIGNLGILDVSMTPKTILPSEKNKILQRIRESPEPLFKKCVEKRTSRKCRKVMGGRVGGGNQNVEGDLLTIG